MLQAGLIDELLIYLAPLLLGDGALGLFHLPELRRMSERIPLEISEVRAIGRDWRFTARPAPNVGAWVGLGAPATEP
jgi:diaminohydroxyphosphoribosylaminopyrimidine deaminase/5-amino-6-(5-phosphoribosylamino)uracil reductase